MLNRQLYYLNEEGVPDTSYKVSVWAETKGGEGPKVVRPVRTWPLRGILSFTSIMRKFWNFTLIRKIY